MEERKRQTRRQLLKTVTYGTATLLSAVFAVPWIGYLVDPWFRRNKTKDRWVPIAKLEHLGETPISFAVIGDARDAWIKNEKQTLGTVWLSRSRKGELRALSAECPHLGCKIALAKNKREFACPCHKSAFALDGKALAGPSPRALDELKTRVKGNSIEVQFKRFELQTSKKIELES
ncbi:MAG: Rieske (2Fe-2S) protein [Myxococcales bacterium]|nr:MAG: Rieske (2Fe-2S) protein [Myxococcales bacterium]